MHSTAAEPAPDPVLTRSFASRLPGGRLAGPLRAYGSVASTQTVARAWADAGAPEGAVVVADHQTAGRGRRGRPWTAPAGTSLLFSVVLRPPLPVARWPEIPLAAGCAVAESLEAVTGVSVDLEWPNDVLVDGRKLAGILAEGVSGPVPLVVLGVGVNVSQEESDWPPDLAGRARSLAGVSTPVSREHLLGALLARLDVWYGVLLDRGFEPVRAAWRQRGLLGARLTVAGRAGAAVDLAPGGQLAVRCEDGETVLLVADDDELSGRWTGSR
ncbi:MAG: biotin--[acetyl-CoA-carboxylase] ligase [Chloroflexi bacterium]|nr:biotin--[acetyl-CoA-carboxylase] ligase [Chloroflexota bacterium]